jgi:hypothetical protein
MAAVRLPTRLTTIWKVPLRRGEEETEIGASPIPNKETWTNCPGACPRSRPPGSFTSKKVSSPVIFSTFTRSAISGA